MNPLHAARTDTATPAAGHTPLRGLLSQRVEALAAHGASVLAEIFIVSDVKFEPLEGASEFVATVSAASGEKCPRCWNYRELGEDGLCERCHDVVAAFEA